MALVALTVGTGVAQGAQAQQPGITRTDLQRHDLSVPGRQAIQVLVEFAPEVEFPRHSHAGEELVYMVEGELRDLPCGEERRPRQGVGARHIHRGEKKPLLVLPTRTYAD